MAFRVGQPPPDEEDKNTRVLSGPPNQVGSRQIRHRSVRVSHLGPDVLERMENVTTTDTAAGGRFFRVGGLLICTHVLSSLSSGSETWTFPAEFLVSPIVVATPFTNLSRSVTVDGVTETQATVRAWTDAGGSSNVNVHVIAIGVSAD